MVDLDADEEDDVEESTRTVQRWTHEEETLLAETLVEVFENAQISVAKSDNSVLRQITDYFNRSTKGYPRTKNMVTGK